MKTWDDYVNIFRDHGFHHDELKAIWWNIKNHDDDRLVAFAKAILKLTEKEK
jgi:hypothetical protein